MPRRPAPARCYRCDRAGTRDYTLTVDGSQQKLTVQGRKLTHAHARCSQNHEWWSRNRTIMAAGKQADARGQAVTLAAGARSVPS